MDSIVRIIGFALILSGMWRLIDLEQYTSAALVPIGLLIAIHGFSMDTERGKHSE
jgi:hypothetical protein